jgi:pimeloyl-ACP methyl ester carboxylesterase
MKSNLISKNISFLDGNIHYLIKKGSDKTLVLLHGFIGSAEIWLNLMEDIEDFTVIAIDLPGHGKTSVFSQNHTMDFMAVCVNEVLIAEKTGLCTMIGHSMGGYVTLQFYEKYGEKIEKIGLFHSHASPDSEQKKKDRDQMIRIVKSRPDIVISEMIPKLFANEDVTPYPKEADLLMKIAGSMPSEGISSALAGMRDRDDKTSLLAKLTVPCLFILGEQDPVIPFESAKNQQLLSPHIVAVNLPAVGHMGFVESYDECLRAIRGFLFTSENIINS